MVRMYANEPLGPPQTFSQHLEVSRLDPRAKLPAQYDETSVGLDVFAFLLTESGRATSRACHLKNVTEIPTGLRVRAPPGHFIQISSRLSLARKSIFVANAPAMLPPMVEVELTILLFNGSYETQYVAHEHRIAQLTLQPIVPTIVRDLSAAQHSEDVHPGPRQGYC